jgi:predicted enzyme related to lactoylglutathione lyase
MPTVQYFEIPADDVTRAQKFYKDVFGWNMQKWNNNGKADDVGYWMFETKDDKGNNGIGGGMMKRIGTEHTVTNYITVSSINEYSSKISESGGKIVKPKTEIPDLGFIVVFLDSENNMFGLFEPKK